MSPQKIDAASEAMKSAPPVAVVAITHISGLDLQDWVFIATLAYISLQCGWLLWRWWRAAHTKGWTPMGEDE